MTTIPLDMMLEDAATVETARPAVTLAEVTAAAERLAQLLERQEALEAELEQVSDQRRQLSEEELPRLLVEAGLKSCVTTTGAAFELQDVVAASIKDDNREAAHAWLRANGLGDLIKNQVTVTFGRGEDEDAKLLLKNLADMAENDALHFGSCEQAERVHPQTLNAAVRERLRNGEPVPVDTLKLVQLTRAVVSKKRGKA